MYTRVFLDIDMSRSLFRSYSRKSVGINHEIRMIGLLSHLRKKLDLIYFSFQIWTKKHVDLVKMGKTIFMDECHTCMCDINCKVDRM